MSNGSSGTRSPSDTPSPPDTCDECDGTVFTPRTRPPSKAARTDKEYVFAFHECAECGAKYNEQPSYLLSTGDVDAPKWQDIFGHPEPYEHQKEAIPDIVDTGLDNGLTLMEGGTGTGKTMIALTAGIRLVRDPRTKYERVMILTSVKQQLRQFENDLAVINANLPDSYAPVRALTLVGKTDLCPYARESKGGITESNVAQRCRQLRDQTSALMGGGIPGPELRDRAIVPEDNEDAVWETAGQESPYIESIPNDTIEFCPFYAQYKTHQDPLFTFGHAENGILHPEELVSNAVKKGVCPHSAMSVLGRDADVVIGNYYHAFDPNTLQITHPLIDDTTFLIADEAHMIEPRVRSVLSKEVPTYFLEDAANEIASVYMAATGETIDDDYVNKIPVPEGPAVDNIQGEGIDPEKLKNIYIALRDVEQMVYRSIREYVDKRYAEWRSDLDEVPDVIEIPLRDPTTDKPDTVSKWAAKRGVPDQLWEQLEDIGDAVNDALTDASENGKSEWAIGEVGELFHDWFARDHTKYFREIQLEKRESDSHPDTYGWEQVFNARIGIHSVMPRAVIGSRINDFGGGVLMSATLAPIDVYEEVIGVDYFATYGDLTLSERTYTSDFPKDNRLSISLDLPKYTYENRGDVTENTETRRQYAEAIMDVVRTTPGNSLVCMPSYAEAEWAATLLDQTESVSKPVLLDKSSSEEETQELKESFFKGGGKVLVTSLRGTLTEGVDYDGDKLASCIVCGVPIDNVGSSKTKAMRTAYEAQFGSAGFAYGLTVPAVRKARQAFGRVIRGSEDVGVRVLADTRYTEGNGNIRGYLSEQDKEEFETMQNLGSFRNKLESFWEDKQ